MKSLLPPSEIRLCLQGSFKSAREGPTGSQSSFVREILTGTTELLRDKPTAAPALFGADSGADFPGYPAGSALRSGTAAARGHPPRSTRNTAPDPQPCGSAAMLRAIFSPASGVRQNERAAGGR